MEASNHLDRRGLLDPPIPVPSIPLVDSLLTHLAGGPKPNPTTTPPPQQDPPQQSPPQQNPPQTAPAPTPTPTPDPGNGNRAGDGGGGGDNPPFSPNPGGGGAGAHDPNISPTSPTPTSNPNSPDTDPSNPFPGSGFPPSQPSGKPQEGSVHLSGPHGQNSDHGDSPGDPNGPGNVVLTTISGVGTTITQVPHSASGSPASSSTGGSSNVPANGGGGSGGGASPSVGGGLRPGVIAAIVIGAVLAVVLLVVFLRNRVKKRRVAQRRHWLSGGEKGWRDTIRSSFGDLRASTFGYPSGHDNSNKNRYSGPFSDSMAAPLHGLASPTSPAPQMTQVSHTDVAVPAIAVHSTARRSTRNSQFSVGSAGSCETDSSEGQWLQIYPDVRYGGNGEPSPSDQHYLPSPISVRPFSPSESWSFPKPPKARADTSTNASESKCLGADPFADPVSQQSTTGISPAELVTRTFEPMAADELAVQVGDEVTVLNLFDDGWANVKVLRRNGSPERPQGLEGLIPIDCLRPRGYEQPLLVDADLLRAHRVSV